MPEDSHSYCKFQIHSKGPWWYLWGIFSQKMAPCGGFKQLGYHPNYTTNLSSIRPSPRYGPDDLDFGKTSKRADEGHLPKHHFSAVKLKLWGSNTHTNSTVKVHQRNWTLVTLVLHLSCIVVK